MWGRRPPRSFWKTLSYGLNNDEATPEEYYLAQRSQVDVAVSLVDETEKSFKESRQKN
jgi:hypothetical protein